MKSDEYTLYIHVCTKCSVINLVLMLYPPTHFVVLPLNILQTVK